jgi:hypothetical protein
VHLLLVHTRKLAVEFVSPRRLVDIKFRLPMDHSSVISILISSGVRVVIVKKSEERVKGGARTIEAAREKSHCAYFVGNEMWEDALVEKVVTCGDTWNSFIARCSESQLPRVYTALVKVECLCQAEEDAPRLYRKDLLFNAF